jgi:hypothetical protein
MKTTKEPDGYILLSRKMTRHPLYASEQFTKCSAWIDLLMLANYKKSHFLCRGIKIEVGIGQLAISQETLAAKWLWTRPRVFRFLKYLENEQMILQQKSGVINLITILNYQKYQKRVTTNVTVDVTTNVTTGVAHPIKGKERKEGAKPISYENGFAPIKKISP